jgi:type IV pilus assembly protein PilV
MRHASGFTLIEALVAMLVLSVGLLGAAAMLLGALRDHGLALRHLAATALVSEFAERLRVSGAPADLPAEFSAAARARFPGQAPDALITFAPATGGATTTEYRITLRWRDAAAAGSMAEVTTVVVAQMPVAG